jgi:prepilin peptidase CpaA
MSLLAFLHVSCLGLLAILLVAAAAQDLSTMHIANSVSLAIAGVYVIWAGLGLVSGRLLLPELALSIGCGIAVVGIGAAAFAIGMLGGSDVKLLAAMSLFAGPDRLLDLLTVTALVGGLIGVAILAGAPIGRPVAAHDMAPRARLRQVLPYGPAIAAGGLWVVASLGMS